MTAFEFAARYNPTIYSKILTTGEDFDDRLKSLSSPLVNRWRFLMASFVER